MRTTLELDDRVLEVARERASLKGISLGRAVSELALAGFGREAAAFVDDGELLVLPASGQQVTAEMVESALDDD